MKIQSCAATAPGLFLDNSLRSLGEVLGSNLPPGTGWGEASCKEKAQVVQHIVRSTAHLPPYDQAVALAIARHESGFNPRARNPTSSAHGVFQVIDATWAGLGLSFGERMQTSRQIEAGVLLLKEYSARLPLSALPNTSRGVQLYALHHDGPSLGYGGSEIGRSKVEPWIPKFEALLKESRVTMSGKAFNR